jgi:hypothetical protein
MIHSRRGFSNITEYVILVSVVAGAAIVMQPYLRVRLQGAMATRADNYSAAAGGGVYNEVRNVQSDTRIRMNMADVDSTVDPITVDTRATVGQQK